MEQRPNSTYPQVATIGTYGFDEAGFFDALQRAKVDVFCDVRRRRGMRGSTYSFANSEKLQKRLAEIGIRYMHFKNLAPSQAIRYIQKRSDKEHGIAKRAREGLSEDFISAYKQECLSGFDINSFLNQLGENVHKIVLFCVEREPMACHRSILAERLAHDLRISVEHIKP
jgi:uncharacterized protein (DUF488 family)